MTFEMLRTLLFQNLPGDALDVYLDPTIMRSTTSTGLNISIALHQSQCFRPAGNLQISEDILVVEYSIDSRKGAAAERS